MKDLYLLRHAKSSWDDPLLGDHDRPLAHRGRETARRLAIYLRQEHVRPALVLCSSAARARQTYDAIAPSLGNSAKLRVEEALYGASCAELLSRLRRVPGPAEAVLLIGHNPALQDLAVLLCGDGDRAALARIREKFPTSAFAALSVPCPWDALGAGKAYLRSLTVPSELPE